MVFGSKTIYTGNLPEYQSCKQLLVGRGLHEGDREFGKWCNLNFPNLRENQEGEREAILLVLGKQLLEGKKGKSKENFGKWVNRNFPNLRNTLDKDENTSKSTYTYSTAKNI